MHTQLEFPIEFDFKWKLQTSLDAYRVYGVLNPIFSVLRSALIQLIYCSLSIRLRSFVIWIVLSQCVCAMHKEFETSKQAHCLNLI